MKRNLFITLVLSLSLVSFTASAQTGKGRKPFLQDDVERSAGRGKSAAVTSNSGPARNLRYSAVADFSNTLNPNGVWSYGFTKTLSGGFIPYTLSGKAFLTGEVGWFGPLPATLDAPGFPLILAKPVASARQLLYMGPGPGGEYTVVRWTATSKGVLDVVGRFQGLFQTSSDVHVLRNDTSVFDANVFNSDGAPFSVTVRMKPGDTIDFAVGFGPDHNYDFDGTGLEAVITPHRYDFLTLDFPGATQTRATGINGDGDVVGFYVDAGGNTRGFAHNENGFRSIDYPGAVLTQARAINDEGEIAGLFDESFTLPSGFEHAYVLREGKFDRVDFPGAADTDILGLNNQGDFAGAYDLGDINTSIGFLTKHGQFVSFEVPGSAPQTTSAFGINDYGQVVGIYGDSVDPNVTHSFLHDGDDFSTIDYPNADSTLLRGINNRGEIVGNCICIDGLFHGVLYSRGNFTIVDFPADSSRTRALGINNRGQIVGFYSPVGTGGLAHGFIASPAKEDGPATYSITDLGTLGGTTSYDGHGLNNAGEVAGVSSVTGAPPFTYGHPFLWQNGKIKDLNTLGGCCGFVGAMGLNDKTEVVGDSFLPGNKVDHPFLWRQGVMADLGTLGGSRGFASGINDRTQIVGGSFLANNQGFRAFLWTDGVMRDLSVSFGSSKSVARGINDSGQIVGAADTSGASAFGFPTFHAYRLDKGVVTDLGTLGGAISDANWINKHGDVAGLSETFSVDPVSGFLLPRAFLWKNGAMIDLGAVTGDNASLANSVNNRGQVVGTSGVGSFFQTLGGVSPVTSASDCCLQARHAFIWEDGFIKDLNQMIPPNSGWLLLAADAINDRGEIVVFAVNTGGTQFHLLLLKPE